jgi:peroxiredoxin
VPTVDPEALRSKSRVLHPLVAGAVALSVLGQVAFAASRSSDDAADEVQRHLKEGSRILANGGDADALPDLKKADKLAKGSCLECLVALSTAYSRSGLFGEAVSAARRLLALNPPPAMMAAGFNQLAVALQENGKATPEKLQEAEAALCKALELLGNKNPVLRYNLGRLLMHSGQKEEALAILRDTLADGPPPEISNHIRLILADPACVDDNCAPNFDVTTLGGDYYTRDDLKGKVVLFHFWGAHCDICERNRPELNRLTKRMAKEPFVLIAVSYDIDRASLKEFARAHGLECPLYFDDGARLTRAFGIKAYPSQVLVGHDGRIVWRSFALSPEQETETSVQIRYAIDRAKKAAEKAAH